MDTKIEPEAPNRLFLNRHFGRSGKWVIVSLLGIVAILLVIIWKLDWMCFSFRTEAQSVWNTIVDYENTRSRLSKMNVGEDVSYLDFYSHAGAGAVVRDPALNKILTFEKCRILRDIVTDLRKKTGRDIGDDPSAWIRVYQDSGKSTN